MTPIDLARAAELASAWLRYKAALRDDPESTTGTPDEAAHERVYSLIREGPAVDAWLVVREILRQTSDDWLDASAAGPLEDLVEHHGIALEKEILAECAADERFRWAFGYIWTGEDRMTPAMFEAYCAARDAFFHP